MAQNVESERDYPRPPRREACDGQIRIGDADGARRALREQFEKVRRASLEMCQPLSAEEFRMQPIPAVSPPWWNLGHTTWFFARNVLLPLEGEYTSQDEQFDYVLNSYYVSLGDRVARDRRGQLTRPTTDQVLAYRASVDQRLVRLIDTIDASRLAELEHLVTIGVQHEQQHQELFYTEIKFIGAQNPPVLRTAYLQAPAAEAEKFAPRQAIVECSGGLLRFGNVEGGWCWDNELPVHRYYLESFGLASRLVTNGEYLEFVEDGGYDRPLLWLDNGWNWKCREQWVAPLYWERAGADWQQWTLRGMQALSVVEPVCHVSFYEADAFARWKSETYAEHVVARLPTEREWEHAARVLDIAPDSGNQLRSGRLQPAPAPPAEPMAQLFGDVWEWTSSYYEPYPGYRPFAGSLAEYNGKFMDNQRVLRGGSCVTPSGHLRRSYRNFWSAETRFQFSGIRLAYG